MMRSFNDLDNRLDALMCEQDTKPHHRSRPLITADAGSKREWTPSFRDLTATTVVNLTFSNDSKWLAYHTLASEYVYILGVMYSTLDSKWCGHVRVIASDDESIACMAFDTRAFHLCVGISSYAADGITEFKILERNVEHYYASVRTIRLSVLNVDEIPTRLMEKALCTMNVFSFMNLGKVHLVHDSFCKALTNPPTPTGPRRLVINHGDGTPSELDFAMSNEGKYMACLNPSGVSVYLVSLSGDKKPSVHFLQEIRINALFGGSQIIMNAAYIAVYASFSKGLHIFKKVARENWELFADRVYPEQPSDNIDGQPIEPTIRALFFQTDTPSELYILEAHQCSALNLDSRTLEFRASFRVEGHLERSESMGRYIAMGSSLQLAVFKF
jgi:hypothetical protein